MSEQSCFSRRTSSAVSLNKLRRTNVWDEPRSWHNPPKMEQSAVLGNAHKHRQFETRSRYITASISAKALVQIRYQNPCIFSLSATGTGSRCALADGVTSDLLAWDASVPVQFGGLAGLIFKKNANLAHRSVAGCETLMISLEN